MSTAFVRLYATVAGFKDWALRLIILTVLLIVLAFLAMGMVQQHEIQKSDLIMFNRPSLHWHAYWKYT